MKKRTPPSHLWQRLPLGLLAVALGASGCFLDLGGSDDPSDPTTPATPTGCDDSDPTLDTDGDGRTDCAEIEGYDISVDLLGFGLDSTNSERRRVTSDPLAADTDGDGIDDAEEFSQRIDPMSADTDADGLTDFEELRRWQTSPRTVDSDDDATDVTGRNPVIALWDGSELSLVPDPADPTRSIPGPGATDPTASDTDGDGKSDLEEHDDPIVDPVVADLPSLRLVLDGDPQILLNYTTSQVIGQAGTIQTTLSSEDETSLSESDSFSTTYTTENSATIAAEVTIGVPPSASLSASATFGSGVEQGSGTEMSETNTTRVATARSEESTASEQEGYEVTTGEIAVSVKLVNDGDITFRVAGLDFLVRRYDRNDAGALENLSLPESQADGFVLRPGEEEQVLLQNKSVNADKIREFLRNPSALFFEPIDPDLRDQNDTSFRFIDDTRPKTALVIVDDGRGTPLRMRIATNVDRADDGSRAGISLRQALQNAGIDFTTEGTGADEAIASMGGLGYELRGAAAPPLQDPDYGEIGGPRDRTVRRFWTLIAARVDDVRSEFGALALDRGFSAIQLHNRDQIRLVLVSDADGDGVYDREEHMHGAKDSAIDSDGDGLSDYFEIKVGWMVNGARVYPSPAMEDSDGDGWSDPVERSNGTDPRDGDTDGDGVMDPIDPDPLTPRPNQAPTVSAIEVTLERLLGSGMVARLTGSAADVDGTVARIEIDWGDGQTETITGSALDHLHTYQDRSPRTIRATAVDNLGVVSAPSTTTLDPEPPGLALRVEFSGSVVDTVGGQNFITSGQPEYVADRGGARGEAADFSGNGSGFSAVLSSAQLPGRPSDETISMWVNFTNTRAERIVGTDEHLQFYTSRGRLHFGWLEGDLDFGARGSAASTLASVEPGRWYHFAGVRRGNELRLYQDGVLQGTATETRSQTRICRFYIGTFPSSDRCSGTSVNNAPIAVYDDVRVYDGALTATQIAVLAAQ